MPNVRFTLFCSLKFLRAWRRQTIIAAIVIAGAVSLLVLTNAMLRSEIEDNLEKVLKTVPHVLIENVSACQELVGTCSPRAVAPYLALRNEKAVYLMVLGVDPLRDRVKPRSGGIMLSDVVMKELGSLGDEILLMTPNGRKVEVKVVGRFDPQSMALDPSYALTTVDRVERKIGKANTAVLWLDNPEDADELARELRLKGYRAESWKNLSRNLLEVIKEDKAYASILSTAVLISGRAEHLEHNPLMTVESRRREIGVLKAVGATSLEAFLIYGHDFRVSSNSGLCSWYGHSSGGIPRDQHGHRGDGLPL